MESFDGMKFRCVLNLLVHGFMASIPKRGENAAICVRKLVWDMIHMAKTAQEQIFIFSFFFFSGGGLLFKRNSGAGNVVGPRIKYGNLKPDAVREFHCGQIKLLSTDTSMASSFTF
jgi:hypothetical protein